MRLWSILISRRCRRQLRAVGVKGTVSGLILYERSTSAPTADSVKVIPRQVQVLNVAEVVDGREATDLITRSKQCSNGGWNSAQIADLVVVEVNFVQFWQELLEPSYAGCTSLGQVDCRQVLPVRFKWLYLGDDLNQLVMRDSKGAFGQKCSISYVSRFTS